MKPFFSFFLLFSVLILSHAQDQSFDMNSVLQEIAKAQQDAKDLFAQNRSNLNGIQSALNEYTLAKNDLALKDIEKQLQKIQLEQEKLRNNTQSQSQDPTAVSQDILDLLNQQPHVLFDDSSSDTSNTDPPSGDEQNEIQLAQVKINSFFGGFFFLVKELEILGFLTIKTYFDH